MRRKRASLTDDVRPAADVEFEILVEKEIKPYVSPAVYTKLMESATAVARAHYGRGYMEGGSAIRAY